MDSAIVAVLALFIYFIPGFVAGSKKHRNATAIWVLNLFLGWTAIGWIVALVWANTQGKDGSAPSPDTHVKCPDCAELVLREARRCKHCGCALRPQ